MHDEPQPDHVAVHDQRCVVTPFRAVFIIACEMEGFEVGEGESEEFARWSALQEVTALLEGACGQINQQFDLALGLIDQHVRSIPVAPLSG